MPQPKPAPSTSLRLSPKYFFLSFGALAALIASVTSFLNLVFETLNMRFPDALNATYQYGYNTYNYESMRSALATLIIIFPIFIIISYFWCRQSERGLGSIDKIIRRWVIYLILFFSALVIVVDLVTLVKYFVAGEITLRFILKVLIALAAALLVGFYYILELLKRKNLFMLGIVFASAAGAFVLGAIIWSFMVMGSPAKQRMLRLDDRRIGDLQNIQWQVISYWQQKEKLPESLKDLKDPISGYSLPVDPEFEKGRTYEYFMKDKIKFELCASFALPIPKGWQENNYGGIRPFIGFEAGVGGDVAMPYPYPGDGQGESWIHEAGRTCFERIIDPERYPPLSKQR